MAKDTKTIELVAGAGVLSLGRFVTAKGSSEVSTSLSSDVNTTDNEINVTSPTDFSVGDYILVGSATSSGDNPEIMWILSIDADNNKMLVKRNLTFLENSKISHSSGATIRKVFQATSGATSSFLSADTEITVADGTKFRKGDVVKLSRTGERMFVNSISGDVITVERNILNEAVSENSTSITNYSGVSGDILTVYANGRMPDYEIENNAEVSISCTEETIETYGNRRGRENIFSQGKNYNANFTIPVAHSPEVKEALFNTSVYISNGSRKGRALHSDIGNKMLGVAIKFEPKSTGVGSSYIMFNVIPPEATNDSFSSTSQREMSFDAPCVFHAGVGGIGVEYENI